MTDKAPKKPGEHWKGTNMSETDSPINPGRREFIKGAAALGATAASFSAGSMTAASYARIVGANDRVRLGHIGVGNRGGSLLDITRKMGDVEIVAIADVYQPYLDKAIADVAATSRAASAAGAGSAAAGGSAPGEAGSSPGASAGSPAPAALKDYRALLERADVDAVVIASPDHWHARQFIDACKAGKDVYVEKPLSLTVAEGRKMVAAAREHGRVSQMGAQRHSSAFIVEACERMRRGDIGKITFVRCWNLNNEYPMGIGRRANAEPPPGLDWDMWLGPAPLVPFQEVIWNYKFRWFWNYSGGQMTNFGTHWIDVIQMALGKDRPEMVTALGGNFAVEDDREVPDTMECVWKYAPGTLVTFSQINANKADGARPGAQIEFRGTLGTLYLSDKDYEIIPQVIQDGPYPAKGPLNRGSDTPRKTAIEPARGTGKIDEVGHLRNFIECFRSRAACNLDVETGHRSTSTTLIGNIAYRLQRTLRWDGDAERFINDPEADAMLDYAHRAPWTV